MSASAPASPSRSRRGCWRPGCPSPTSCRLCEAAVTAPRSGHCVIWACSNNPASFWGQRPPRPHRLAAAGQRRGLPRQGRPHHLRQPGDRALPGRRLHRDRLFPHASLRRLTPSTSTEMDGALRSRRARARRRRVGGGAAAGAGRRLRAAGLRRGIDVLAPLPLGADPNASFAGAFLMAPWANRLDEGRLPVGGTTWHLPLNRPHDGTAIHGLVRDAAWTAAEAGRVARGAAAAGRCRGGGRALALAGAAGGGAGCRRASASRSA